MKVDRNQHLFFREPNGAFEADAFQRVPSATVELLRYWRVLKPHAKLLGIAALGVMLATVLVDKFLLTTYYRAKVIIRPEPPEARMTGGANSLASGLLGSLGGGLSQMALPLMGKGDNELEAQQDIAILDSYDFTMNVARRFHLRNRLLGRLGEDPSRMSSWQVYQLINEYFDSEYDYKSGGLTLYYIDPDPATAQDVLTDFIQALRDKLRAQEASDASIGVKALEDEISHTADPMLQSQLYLLMADQLQREKTAQMDADFAFKTIEPPMVPGVKFSPHISRQAALAGFLTFVLLSAYFLIKEGLSHAKAHLDAWDIHTSRVNGAGVRVEEEIGPPERERLSVVKD
jgi:hypothetical protein